MSKIQMYRPYFSAAEISIMYSLLENVTAANPDNVAFALLYKKLRMIKFKIGNDMIAPALERKESVEESLGLAKKESGIRSETRERLDSLAAKMLAEGLQALSKEEIEEGKKLELLEYGMEMGMFASEQ